MSKRKSRVKLSQVFLKDKNIIDKIINSLEVAKDEVVVEIGGGEGAITFPLISKGARLIVFEKDEVLRRKLLKTSVLSHFHDRILVLGDFLRFNFDDFNRFYGIEKIKIVGNIPYHITGMILRKIIKEHAKIDSVYLMVQKDVAKRLIAKPSTKEYGALSVLIQTLFNVKILFDIKPGSFYPIPKVVSSFIKLSPKVPPMEVEKHFREFEHIVRSAFSSRRKKLKNTLFKTIPLNTNKYYNMRAEDLSVSDYVHILKKSIN